MVVLTVLMLVARKVERMAANLAHGTVVKTAASRELMRVEMKDSRLVFQMVGWMVDLREYVTVVKMVEKLVVLWAS